VFAVIDIPEMEQELAEDQAQLASKQSSLETARHEVDHQKANITLQDVTLKRQEVLFNQAWISAQALDQARATEAIATADLGVAEANSALAEPNRPRRRDR
jgi:multidrug resistance efflux pump